MNRPLATLNSTKALVIEAVLVAPKPVVFTTGFSDAIVKS